jgi:hypothetical protein
MNWEDERYVRLYTRDTGDWCALSWDGQALLMQLLRKADRSGVIQLGRRGRTALPNMLFHGAQADRIDVALTELLDDGCVELHGTNLVIPNFTVAQEAKQSDKLRQQESRARRLAQARSDLVSKPTNVSHAVTDGHESSQPVTPSVPSVLNQPNRAEFAGDASHPPPSPRVVAPDLRHEAGERMTPPARIQEAPTAAQGSLLPAEDAPTAKPARRPKSPKALSTTAIAWQAYAEAYEARYKTAPEKNGQVMGQLARLVANVGGKAPDLCRYYLTRTDARYRYHPVGMMLSDYQGLLTAMTTGRVITETTARERERAASSPMWQYVADQMDKDRGDVVDVESKPE